MDSRKRGHNKENDFPKKKKRGERSYHPKRDPDRRKKTGVTDPSVVLNTRFLNGNTFVDSNTGLEVPLKHVIVVNSALATENNVTVEELKETLDPELAKIPTYRPLASTTEYSANGTPIKGATPGKTEVRRTHRFGFFSILSNNTHHIPLSLQAKITSIPSDNDFFNSPEFHALNQALSNVKTQTVTVTPELLHDSKVAIDADGGTRPISQARAATQPHLPASRGSAPKYIKAAKMFSQDFKWEWLHLVAYRVLHAQSQNTDNLVIGSYPANSCMMGIEAELQYLASQYPEGFKLEITSDLIESPDGKITHVANTIKYNIKTPSFDYFPLEFNAQEPNDPHKDFNLFFHALVKALVVTTKKAQAAKKASADTDTKLLVGAKQIVDKKPVADKTKPIPTPFYERRPK